MEATVGTIDLGSKAPAFTSLAPWDSGAGYPDWSPDGTTIVYVQPEPGEPPGSELARSDVWTVPAAGGEPRRLTDYAHAGGRTLQPTWTPDGTAVILVAETEIGQPMGGLVPAAGGAVSRVGEADASMTHPRLRPVP